MATTNLSAFCGYLAAGQQAVRLFVDLRNLFTSNGDSKSDVGKSKLKEEVKVSKGRPDGGHQSNDVTDVREGTPSTLDVHACLLNLFPKGVTAICGGVDALQLDIIKGFDTVVGTLKDKSTIRNIPEIKAKLGLVTDACDCVLEDIKEANKSRRKRFPASTMKDLDKADIAATELYMLVKEFVPDGSAVMTKQAKIQVMPYIVVISYATRIRVIIHLVERDMTRRKIDKKRYLNRACKIMNDSIAVVHSALEGLMANTSLLEIALDYQLPMAMYLTLMMSFRASVDALKSSKGSPKDITAWDDGLSSIRESFHWNPNGAGDQGQGSTVELSNIAESVWWARFTDTDLIAEDTNKLRTRILVRELSHVMGAGSDEFAANLALKPDKKSALLQLPPASALRAALRDKIIEVCDTALGARLPPPPESFARISGAPPPDMLRQSWSQWLFWQLSSTRALKMDRMRTVDAPRTLGGHDNWVFGVAVCADNERVVSGSCDETTRVWSLSSGQHLRSFSDGISSVLCVAVSPDGKRAVSGSNDMTVSVWGLDGGSAQYSLYGHTDWVAGVAVSPDGRSIASASDDRTIRLWKMFTGQCEATLTGHASAVFCVAFSPDGVRLVSGSADKSIRVWNVRTRTPERTLHGHSGAVYGVAVTPDSRRVVSGSADRSIKVWSLSSGAEEMVFMGHSNWVRCVVVFPDGQRIASGSEDKSIRVWNLRTGAIELTLMGHTNIVSCVAVSPDGRSLVSGSGDNTIKVWPLKGGNAAR